MDFLSNALRNLTDKERYLLQERVKNQEKKSKLLAAVKENFDISNEDLSMAISYGKKLKSLYTLKTRLLDDLLKIKLELNNNELIEIKRLVQSIRGLMYARDKSILLRQLRLLQKKCLDKELYAELREVHFCYRLLHEHDQKQAKKHETLMMDAEENHRIISEMEEIFYFHLLKTQNLFFLPESSLYEEGLRHLSELKVLHEKLRSKRSLFLYLSAELTLCLNDYFDIRRFNYFFDKLQELKSVYKIDYVSIRYPNCDVPICCLESRLYFLSRKFSPFIRTQSFIRKNVEDVQGYQMFDASYLYYLYVESLYLIRHNADGKKLVYEFLSNSLDESATIGDLTTASGFKYLTGLKEFYNDNYLKSSILLVKGREFFGASTAYTAWSVIENVLLNMICLMYMDEDRTFAAERKLLIRLLRKFKYDEQIKAVCKRIMVLIKSCFRDKRKILTLKLEINAAQQDYGLMRLVELTS